MSMAPICSWETVLETTPLGGEMEEGSGEVDTLPARSLFQSQQRASASGQGWNACPLSCQLPSRLCAEASGGGEGRQRGGTHSHQLILQFLLSRCQKRVTALRTQRRSLRRNSGNACGLRLARGQGEAGKKERRLTVMKAAMSSSESSCFSAFLAMSFAGWKLRRGRWARG